MNNVLDEQYFKRIQKVCLIQVVFNYLLTIIKFIGGFISGSKTLISDGINSLGDIVSSTVFYIGGKIIVTNGFTKKTPKTLRQEIRLAQERRADYIRRMEGLE